MRVWWEAVTGSLLTRGSIYKEDFSTENENIKLKTHILKT